MSDVKRYTLFIIAAFLLLANAFWQECNRTTSAEKGVMTQMKTYNIGRFSINVPASMEMTARTGRLRYVTAEEIFWHNFNRTEHVRAAEWEQFTNEINKLEPPKGNNKIVIMTYDFPEIGKWARGVFYYNKSVNNRFAPWALLIDYGKNGVWLKSDRTEIEDEKVNRRMRNNLINIAKAYQPLDLKDLKIQRPDNRFFLRYGAINLPYSAHEESSALFEGHPLDLTLSIEMEMDFTQEIETMGLIKRTKGLLAAALLQTEGGISKIRLQKREMAGMPGEEALLLVREGQEKNILFTWEYNGKDDSGEYPTTRIEMESHSDADLDEKLKIWDAILDSMQPLFERKK